MDKYEFKLSLNEINTLIGERRFEQAAEIADRIDWNHVKSADTLCRVSEVYKAVGDYEKSRDVMSIAHEREVDNPAIVYALCELTIYLYGKGGFQNDLTRALQLMQEYQALEPQNPRRLILQYKMYGVSPVSDQEKISVLEQLHREKASARWDYELAQMYASKGESEKAADICRGIVRDFAGSRYEQNAQRLLGQLKDAEPAQISAEPKTATEEVKRTAEKTTQPKPVLSAPAKTEEFNGEPEKAEEQETSAAETSSEPELAVQSRERVPAADSYADAPQPDTDVNDTPAYDVPAERDFYSAGAEETGEGQLSIGEVMAEWEKIRRDIRRANDEKRAQRILEDTGAILQDFDETARHGLLEDIEKGVARQRRQVRSGLYRMSDPVRQDDISQRRPEQGDRREAPARRYRVEEEMPIPAQSRREEAAPAPARRYRPAEVAPAPAYAADEDEDVRIYGSRDDGLDDIATRRWNSEEIHRAMLRQEQIAREEELANEAERKRIQAEERASAAKEAEEAAQKTSETFFREAEEITAGQDEAPVEETYDEPSAEEAYDEAPAEEVYDEPPAEEAYDEASAEEVYDEPPAEEAYDEASAEEVYDEPPAEEAYDEASAEEVYDEPPAEEAYDEASAEEVYDEPPAEEAYDEASAEEVYDETPVEETYDEAPVEETYDEPPAEEAYDEAPAEEVYDEPPAEEVYDETSAEETCDETSVAEDHEEVPAEEAPAEETYEEAPAKPVPAQSARKPEGTSEEAGQKKGRRELSKEERRIFGPFCRVKENVEQLTEALDQISLAASTGNVLIIGNDATADRVAKGILEITRRSDSNFTGKVARVTGEALNRLKPEGFAKTFVKLESGALIVSKAADIAPKAMERLSRELEGKEHGLIVLMTDGSKRMEQFRHENEKYLGSFTSVINIRPLDDKALVAYARDYALSQDYSIDEFGQLALAQRISAMQTSTHQVTMKEVRDLVDEAIDYASKKSPRTLLAVMSRRRYDENDRIIIHEKDFMHDA